MDESTEKTGWGGSRWEPNGVVGGIVRFPRVATGLSDIVMWNLPGTAAFRASPDVSGNTVVTDGSEALRTTGGSRGRISDTIPVSVVPWAAVWV
jgi:hypothetical protein